MPNKNHFLGEGEEPIVVNGMVLPTALAVMLRLGIYMILPYLVGKGIIPEGSDESIATYGLVFATAAYGLWKSVKTKKDFVAAADAAPNDQFVVKK